MHGSNIEVIRIDYYYIIVFVVGNTVTFYYNTYLKIIIILEELTHILGIFTPRSYTITERVLLNAIKKRNY